MENPATWNDTQKLINAALYQNLNRESPGSCVRVALEKHNLLKPGVEVGNLTELIDKKFAKYNEMLSAGFCGSSASSQVYNLLLDLGVVS